MAASVVRCGQNVGHFEVLVIGCTTYFHLAGLVEVFSKLSIYYLFNSRAKYLF